MQCTMIKVLFQSSLVKNASYLMENFNQLPFWQRVYLTKTDYEYSFVSARERGLWGVLSKNLVSRNLLFPIISKSLKGPCW